MSETEKMVKALEDYYGLSYTPVQRKAILSGLKHPPKPYLLDLYTQVINAFSSQFKTLPDLSVIRNAQRGMNPADVYLPPEKLIEDRSEETMAIIDSQLAEMHDDEGESNHFERERIREKVRKGDATKYEVYWIHVVDDLGGKWTAGIDRYSGIA